MATVALWLARVFAGVEWIGQLLVTGVVAISTPIQMLLVLCTARRSVISVLPNSLSFMNTYDDPGMNQGMHMIDGKPVAGKYEQQVKDIYDKYGWRAKTVYWLGWRNQCYTLFNWMAAVIYPQDGIVTKETTNWKILTSGPYWCFLNRNVDVGFGWKLFNGPGKCSFYFRPRFWKKPSN